MPTIVHFDIPSDNIERSKKFYGDLFGWKIDKWSGSSEAMEYWLISTVDDKGNKALGGGLGKRQSPQKQITNLIDVESVDEYSSKEAKSYPQKCRCQVWVIWLYVQIQRIMALTFLKQTELLNKE